MQCRRFAPPAGSNVAARNQPDRRQYTAVGAALAQATDR
jgi:hypothetical protein